MKRVIFLSRDKDQFIEIEQMLIKKKVTIEWTGTGKDLLALLSDTSMDNMIDLMIMEEAVADASARALVESVIAKSPMTNCVVAGTMEKKQFHDLYEGYGVLMQIPPCPNSDDAQKLGDHIDKIMSLS